MTPLSQAIEAASAYAVSQVETVHMVSARSLDSANRWFRVEGWRRAFRRTYMVDLLDGRVTEIKADVLLHLPDDDLTLIVQHSQRAAT